MSGVVGAMTSKLVIGTATILVSAAINGRLVDTVLDARWPTSVFACAEPIKPHLQRLCSNAEGNGAATYRVGLTGGTMSTGIAFSRVSLPDRADLRFGRDMLASEVLAFDLRRHRAGLVLRSAYRRDTSRLVPLTVSKFGDGSIAVPVYLEDGSKKTAILDLMDTTVVSVEPAMAPPDALHGARVSVDKAGARLMLHGVGESDLARRGLTIGLLAFNDRRVVVDLPHDRLWVSED